MIGLDCIRKVSGVNRMAVNLSEFVPDNNLNWLALAMHQDGMSLRAMGYKVGADYKTVKRALMVLGVEF